jgi:hypothetical protein
MQGKILIHIDILGFERLPEIIASYSHQSADKIRNEFIEIISKRVAVCESEALLSGRTFSDDSWLLVVNSQEAMFRTILNILNHKTGYTGFEEISLEIALGFVTPPIDAPLEGSAFISQNQTINFLKSHISDRYRNHYKETKAQSIKTTFIVLGEELLAQLEPLDRDFCKVIEETSQSKQGYFYLADIERVKERGQVFKFLEKINHSGSKIYDRIDQLYIAPLEFGEIKDSLIDKRIVFITGTPEYGKTYTAIRLLWEYFLKGYSPIWIEGGEEQERQYARKRLEDIEQDLVPKNIIYYEDPFGKTKYEKRESLERDIDTIINLIKKVTDVFVIVTSREEIFKQFEKERLSGQELKKFEKQLNIKRPSYDSQKRVEMLDLWARSQSCKWFNIPSLKSIIEEEISVPNKLPTPLSIRSFVISSVGKANEDELIQLIEQKSKETARSFATEIENMTEEKQLFLSFLFILRRIRISRFSRLYEQLAKQLQLSHYKPFDEVIAWFNNDKLDIGKKVGFSHPSYLQAVDYLLVRNNFPTDLHRRIFFPVLNELSKNGKYKHKIPFFIASNYRNLPSEIREMLFILAERKATSTPALHALWTVYREFPDDIKNLYRKLSSDKETGPAVGCLLATHFRKLDPAFRNEILLNLLRIPEANAESAQILSHFSDIVPAFSLQKLPELSKDPQCAYFIAIGLSSNYRRLTPDLKKMLVELGSTQERAARAIASWAVYSPIGRSPEFKEIVSRILPQYLSERTHSKSAKKRRRGIIFLSKAMPMIDKKFALELLKELSNDSAKIVNEKALELLKVYSNSDESH